MLINKIFLFEKYFKNITETKINKPFLNILLLIKKNINDLAFNQKKNFSEKIESKEINDYSNYISSN